MNKTLINTTLVNNDKRAVGTGINSSAPSLFYTTPSQINASDSSIFPKTAGIIQTSSLISGTPSPAKHEYV